MDSGEITAVGEQYTEEQILEGLTETARTISRLMVTMLALALFSLLAVFQPDAYLLDTAAKVNVPSVGATTAKALLIVGPLLLIGVRLYLQIFVEHWLHLDGIANQRKLKRPAVVSPMRHRLLAFLTGVALYLLVPVALAAFTWKAMALPQTWGHGLFALTIFVAAVHLMQDWSRKWSYRLYICASIGAGVGVIGVFPFLDDLRRPFNLRYADLHNTDLAYADLRGADMRQADLTGADLRRAKLQGAKLRRANLQEANLRFAKLQGANLFLADLRKADFTEADLKSADLSRTKLQGASFWQAEVQNAELTRANLEGANLRQVNLLKADLAGANLQGARLFQANLQGANLQGADLYRAFLQNAKLTRANLRGANLSEANVRGADLSGACGDKDTRLPKGYEVPNCETQSESR